MNSQVFTLSASSPTLPATGLGFEARSVMVTNYTNQFVQLPDVSADASVPPFTFGAVIPLPPGIRQARAALVSTTPVVSTPPVPNSNATLTFVEAELPPDPGHLLAQSQFNLIQLLGSITAGAGGNKTTTFTLPAGTQAIRIVPDAQSGFAPSQVIVQGGTTSNQYALLTGPLANAIYIIPVDVSIDTTLKIQLTSPVGGSSKIWVSATSVPESVSIIQLPNGVLNVFNSGFGAFWQAARLTTDATGSIAAGATVTEIAGVASQFVYMHTINLDIDTASPGNDIYYLDGAGGTIIGRTSLVTTTPGYQDWKGRFLTLGNGFAIKNPNGGPVIVRGTLSYSQG